jgi:hypothetical protein
MITETTPKMEILIPFDQAKEILLERERTHDYGNDTVHFTTMKYLTVARIGFYDIIVRALRGYNRDSVRWGGGIESVGSMHTEGDKKTFEEIIDFAIAKATEKEKEFEAMMEQQRKYAQSNP